MLSPNIQQKSVLTLTWEQIKAAVINFYEDDQVVAYLGDQVEIHKEQSLAYIRYFEIKGLVFKTVQVHGLHDTQVSIYINGMYFNTLNFEDSIYLVSFVNRIFQGSFSFKELRDVLIYLTYLDLFLLKASELLIQQKKVVYPLWSVLTADEAQTLSDLWVKISVRLVDTHEGKRYYVKLMGSDREVLIKTKLHDRLVNGIGYLPDISLEHREVYSKLKELKDLMKDL